VRAFILTVVLPLTIAVFGSVGCAPSDPPVEQVSDGQMVSVEEVDTPVAVNAEASVGHSPESSGLLGAWLLEDLVGRGVMDMVQTTIEFDADGRVFGDGGCNRYTGSYVFEDGRLSLGPIAGTKKMCPEAIMDQEDRFLRVLGSINDVSIDGPFLYLAVEGDEQPLKFSRMADQAEH